MSLLKYPYTNLHELNLDWIIEQLNKEGAVLSVNGKHGTVTLTGEDINRTPNNQQTIEQALTAQGSSIQAARTLLGTTPLPTTAQSVTGAIDELSGDIGDINEKMGNTPLPTTAQTLTGAAAELDGDVTNINNKIGNTALPTTAQTLTGAVAEHEQDITTLNSKFMFQRGEAFTINGAEILFRTLADRSAILFGIRLPKECASNVNSFTVEVTGNSTTWFTGTSLGAVQSGATADNINLKGRRVVQFSLPVTNTIQETGFGICELNATITFTA